MGDIVPMYILFVYRSAQFVVDFLEVVHSEYSENVSFCCGASQSDIVSTGLFDDPDRMHEVEDSLLENSLYRIFPENPLLQ